MNFDGVIPWIDVSFPAAGIFQVPRGAQKNSWHMHELADREIGDQKADER